MRLSPARIRTGDRGPDPLSPLAGWREIPEDCRGDFVGDRGPDPLSPCDPDREVRLSLRCGPRSPVRSPPPEGRRVSPTRPPASHAEPVHPQPRRARLRARADDAHPGARRAHPPARHGRERDRLGPDRLPARRRRRDADRRPPRRHVRQAPAAGRQPPRLRRGLRRRRARRLARHRRLRPRPAGLRRRHLPPLLRDHPRRVPAREGRGQHRDDLRHLRHRRRRRPDRRRPDRRQLLLPLDLLGRRDQRGARRPGHLPLGAGVPRARPRPDRRPRRAAPRGRPRPAAAGDLPRQHLGLGRARRRSA